jgi:hypothetical protein
MLLLDLEEVEVLDCHTPKAHVPSLLRNGRPQYYSDVEQAK